MVNIVENDIDGIHKPSLHVAVLKGCSCRMAWTSPTERVLRSLLPLAPKNPAHARLLLTKDSAFHPHIPRFSVPAVSTRM